MSGVSRYRLSRIKVCATCGHDKSNHQYVAHEKAPQQCRVPGCHCHAFRQLEEGERVSKHERRSAPPTPRFSAGDRVTRDDGSASGEIAIVGSYDESLGCYRYKVQQDNGSRIWWNESSTRPEIARNGRATVSDPAAVRELSLYIENEYSLIGAPNSMGKSIDANLRRKLERGTYDPALAPQAWQHLIDEGAKRYTREFGSGGAQIFNAATRREVASDFARAWEEENFTSKRALPRMEEGDYVLTILDRDARIGLYRVASGGQWVGPIGPRTASLNAAVAAMETDAKKTGAFARSVFEVRGDGGVSKVGRIVHGRYQGSN